jgi:hypothetical protein
MCDVLLPPGANPAAVEYIYLIFPADEHLTFTETLYSKTCQVGHLFKLATCRCWPHIGGTGEVPFNLHRRLPL